MKKILLFTTLSVSIIVFILSTRASALGGFVSIKGSDYYHEIYCIYVEQYNLNDLQWYDTSEDAEADGLTPCQECNASNGFGFIYDIDTFWKTDDHLIQSAMEIEYERGYQNGEKNGYDEGFSEGEHNTGSAFYNSYEAGYNDGCTAAYDDGYDDGFDDGYETAYEKAYKEGIRDAESKAELEKEEMSDNRKSAIFLVLFLICIGFAINVIDKRKRK